jgi:hypothetical protein
MYWFGYVDVTPTGVSTTTATTTPNQKTTTDNKDGNNEFNAKEVAPPPLANVERVVNASNDIKLKGYITTRY